MTMHTFFRADGTEFRCRAAVESEPDFWARQDWARVVVQTPASAKKFSPGTTWGMGRHAPVIEVTVGAGR